ncbi:Translation Initiation factor eIF- 4e [Carpediemonas membranifera]|uniref:Translation Initiation factor eIF- 4e n=1 Tax=Carpediemonas membranifera TaxID=201153 RepID=A0A8J6E0G0_9EUKA|nr:Translation Initiation factor eIF- 4e [Carpediemonas membranifera]|eukprot:KAG9392168.1 Translation Initiation factor eIF- 4e [Carpediemonas membranifera]
MAETTQQTEQSDIHGFQSTWVTYYNKRDTKVDAPSEYKENLSNVASISSVEDFNAVFSQMKRPSDLEKDDNVHIFREGSLPLWESLPNGGTFSVKIRRQQELTVNHIWEAVAAAAMGEVFEEPGIIGVTVHVRAKDDSVMVWLDDARDGKVRQRVQEKIKNLLGVDTVDYKANVASMKVLKEGRKSNKQRSKRVRHAKNAEAAPEKEAEEAGEAKE